jgi:hypothetical protein
MKRAQRTAFWSIAAVMVLGICWFGIRKVRAHCDSLDGPVIVEAEAALAKGDATPLLKWVPKGSEAEIRKLFAQTLVVRDKGKDARELADRFFFETLVRIHRAGEGAPYTGLKPAGGIAPAVAAADKALAAGSVDALSARIGDAVRDGIRKRFAEVMEKKRRAGESVEAGREYVAAYVEYVHFVEGIHDMVAKGAAHGHGEQHAEH